MNTEVDIVTREYSKGIFKDVAELLEKADKSDHEIDEAGYVLLAILRLGSYYNRRRSKNVYAVPDIPYPEKDKMI